MPKYSAHSLKVLSEINSDLQILFKTVLPMYDHKLVEGQRGEAAQQKAFASGASTKMFPYSKHNRTPSDACDADPYPLKKGGAGKEQSIHFAGYCQGVSDILFRLGELKRRTRHLGFTKLGDWRHRESV